VALADRSEMASRRFGIVAAMRSSARAISLANKGSLDSVRPVGVTFQLTRNNTRRAQNGSQDARVGLRELVARRAQTLTSAREARGRSANPRRRVMCST
jgi:hypothetical protein